MIDFFGLFFMLPSQGTFDLSHHLRRFCSHEVLKPYGLALEDFLTNGRFVAPATSFRV